jgi:hypothetical protein
VNRSRLAWRRLPWRWLTVLLALVLAGLLAVAVRNHFDPGSRPVAISGTVFVTSAGTMLEVDGRGCDKDQLTAVETPSRVTLRLVLSPYYCLEPSLAGWTGTVRLRSPLGHRALIDGQTGKPLPYFDERQFARVTYLPPGTSGPIKRSWGNFWERLYTTADGRGIVVTQEPGDQTATLLEGPGAGNQVRSVTIRGKPGTLQYEPSFPGASTFTNEQVVWRDGGYTFQVQADANRTVTVSQLLQIANGIVLP